MSILARIGDVVVAVGKSPIDAITLTLILVGVIPPYHWVAAVAVFLWMGLMYAATEPQKEAVRSYR